MKARMASRWTLTYPDGTGGWGFCPKWASQPVPPGATLTREPVLVVGVPTSCTYPGCDQTHRNPGPPRD